MIKQIAKIDSTQLGYEDHGIFTCMLYVDYGGVHQGIGGYCLDKYNKQEDKREGTAYGHEFIARTLRACGVDSWEKLKGRTIFVLFEGEDKVCYTSSDLWGRSDKPLGIENLPTEKGERFIFKDIEGFLKDFPKGDF